MSDFVYDGDYQSIGAEEDIDGDPDSDEIEVGSDDHSEYELGMAALKLIVQTYSAYFFDNPAHIDGDGVIRFSIPSGYLPLALRTVCGFDSHSIVLEVTLRLSSFSWRLKPEIIQIRHPIYQNLYPGSSLIASIKDSFFSPNYRPKNSYKSAPLLLRSPGVADRKYVLELVSAGFDEERSRNALILFNNSKPSAVEFLTTGNFPDLASPVEISYIDCPLVHFVLELADALLDLSDHCCICRKTLLSAGVKPSVCDSQFCSFRMTEIGLGNSLYNEIKRDPAAADLMITIFGLGCSDDYLEPKPANTPNDRAAAIVVSLPSIHRMLKESSNDQELSKFLGQEAFDLLRWIILSNRSQLISLPQELHLKSIPTANQFMTLLSSPQAEQQFGAHKAKYGSLLVWHGSAGERWHSIMRNGLKVATGTKMQANGAALGHGIYFAKDSRVSFSYSGESKNIYKNSELGRELTLIGLCEVSFVPELKDHQWALTLKDPTAVVVRFLFAGEPFSLNTFKDPITHMPSLEQVLEVVSKNRNT